MPQGAPTNVESKVSELKVSAYTMTVEPGLYCVFNSPESSMPDGQSGLPNVRIGAAPGPDGAGIEVFGVDKEGWLGESAATLVRSGLAGAKLLVTVYQDANAGVDAPQLQVVRLGGGAIGGAPVAARPSPAAPERMELMAHIYGRGDVGNHMGDWTGEPGSKRWIEGFGIAELGAVPAGDLEYQAVLGRGWLSPWSEGGQFCGSRGMSLPILGLRIRLKGRSAETHGVVLSATFVDGTQVGPVGSGDPCEAESLAALESFRVQAVPMGDATAAPAAPKAAKAPRAKAAPPAPQPAAKPSRGAKAKEAPAKPAARRR